MVYTVTFSPALDYVVRLGELREGEVNRAERAHIVPGGKGINVSVLLSRLGIPTRALGFCAGFTGSEIERRLAGLGIETDFIRTPGVSRINVKLKAGKETDINAPGAEIGHWELETLFKRLDDMETGSVLVLAGAVPEGLGTGVYEQILNRLRGREIRTAVDATGELFRRALPCRPFLVKPNAQELGELLGEELKSPEEIARGAKELVARGAQNVIVSLGGAGAVYVNSEGELFSLPAPRGTLVDSVGAGDSVVAGFLAGTLRGYSAKDAFRLGVAAGSATAFSEWLAEGEDVERFFRSLPKL